MRYCRKCGVGVTGTSVFCPFCQNELLGEPDGENRFPDIPAEMDREEHWLLIRLMVLGSVIAAGVCVAVNVSLPQTGWWSLFVVAGLASGWISGGIILKKLGNLLKGIFWQVCVISVLVLLWDFGTGFWGWSVDFVLPVLYACSMIAMFTLAWFMSLQPQDYVFYLILNIMTGFLPLIPLVCGMLHVVYPSVICVFLGVVLLAVLLLFQGKTLKEELGRRFHL